MKNSVIVASVVVRPPAHSSCWSILKSTSFKQTFLSYIVEGWRYDSWDIQQSWLSSCTSTVWQHDSRDVHQSGDNQFDINVDSFIHVQNSYYQGTMIQGCYSSVAWASRGVVDDEHSTLLLQYIAVIVMRVKPWMHGYTFHVRRCCLVHCNTSNFSVLSITAGNNR